MKLLRCCAVLALTAATAGCSLLSSTSETVPAASGTAAEQVLQCPAPVIAECPAVPVAALILQSSPVLPDAKKTETEQLPATPKHGGDRQLLIIGATEWIQLEPPGIRVLTRVDTGAETSSLHATNILRFEREGERWVRFDFTAEEFDTPITIERPLSRRVRIRRSEVEDQRRLVVEMRVTMGEIDQIIEMTLTDRSDMEYQALLGRNFLTDNAIVDVSQNNLTN